MEKLNLYPITYYGNKYKETRKYLIKGRFNQYDYKQYDIIMEPFGGIYGFSRAIFNECKEDTIFLINDINTELIKLHNEFKINDPLKLKKKILKYCNENNIFEMSDKEYSKFIKNNNSDSIEFIYLKFNNIGLHKIKKLKTHIEKNFNNLSTYEKFFENCIFYNMEAFEFLKHINTIDYYKGKRKLIFFDPPYFDTCNKNYIQQNNNEISEGFINMGDNTGIYINILKEMKNYNDRSDCLMIINKCELLTYLYSNNIYEEYQKIYSMNTGKKQNIKRKTTYMVVRNFN